MKSYKFQDQILVDQPMLPESKDQAAILLGKDKKPRLKVSIDATHSGVLTNGRVYPGKYVSTGYRSFFSKDNGGTAEYDKPILKHHSMENDPIGRIVKASYIPFKQGEDFMNDFLNPEPMGNKGSGVVTIDALITDPDSIEKILDGRFLSVSVGHSSPTMQCSVCGKSIIKCSHVPGKIYDEEGEEAKDSASEGITCYAVTGELTYHECSFVNMPAQPPAKLINFRWEDCDKQSFDKEDLIIKSLNRGKKGTVRAFTLCDEDSELDLLQSLKAKGKLVVSMASSKSQTDAPSNQKTDTGETSKVHQDSGNQNIEVANVENQAIDKKMTQKEDVLMDKTNETGGLDIKTLETSLKALSLESDSLKSQIAASKTEVDSLKKTVESKDSEIKRLSEDRVKMQADMATHLATALASFRIRLAKPDAAGLDSKQKFDEYVGKLAKRTSESLRDSIEDLVLELATSKTAPVVDQANKLLQEKPKVDSAILAVAAKPEAKPAQTKTQSKDILDQEID